MTCRDAPSRPQRRQAGFTLIEVIVAALVLAIGVRRRRSRCSTAPTATPTQQRARRARRTSPASSSEYARGHRLRLSARRTVVTALRATPGIAGAGRRVEDRAPRRDLHGHGRGLHVRRPEGRPRRDAARRTPARPAGRRRRPARRPRSTPTTSAASRSRCCGRTARARTALTQIALSSTRAAASARASPTSPSRPPRSPPAPRSAWIAALQPRHDDPPPTRCTGPSTTASARATSAAPAATTWAFTWDLGTLGTRRSTMDGTYLVSAQAFDTRGVAGRGALGDRARQPPHPLRARRASSAGATCSTAASSISTGAATGARRHRLPRLARRPAGRAARRSARTAGSTTRSGPAAPTRAPTARAAGRHAELRRRRGRPHRPQGGLEHASATATRPAASCPTQSTRPDPPVANTPTIVDGLPVLTLDRAVGRPGAGPASDPLLPHLPRRRHAPRRPLRRDRRRRARPGPTRTPATSTAHKYWVTAVDDQQQRVQPVEPG